MKFKKILLRKIDSSLKLAGFAGLIISTLLFILFLGIHNFFYSNHSIVEYNQLNKNLILDIKKYNDKLVLLEDELVKMQEDDNYLRLAVQLNPSDIESGNIGFGGSSFDTELFLNRRSFVWNLRYSPANQK